MGLQGVNPAKKSQLTVPESPAFQTKKDQNCRQAVSELLLVLRILRVSVTDTVSVVTLLAEHSMTITKTGQPKKCDSLHCTGQFNNPGALYGYAQ